MHNLSRALKTARGFERQKLGKREQRAKKEKDEKLLERVGEEIAALKVCLLGFLFLFAGSKSEVFALDLVLHTFKECKLMNTVNDDRASIMRQQLRITSNETEIQTHQYPYPAHPPHPPHNRALHPHHQRNPKPKLNHKKPLTSTTFLPSLSMGGYFPGSESEPEELEPMPGRKNRMGQTARRALWEKKYGAAANHVKKAKKAEKANRDSGWDLRRGATGSGEKRGRGNNM